MTRRGIILLLLMLAGFVAGWQGETIARTIVDRFDHFETGFPLDGRHADVACDACHVNGRFAATPRRCADCHNNIIAQGKTFRHIPVSDACDACHSTRDFLTQRFDHTLVYVNCVTCHNNFLAPGKTADHPPTSNVCENCHNTIHWDQILPGAPSSRRMRLPGESRVDWGAP